MSKQQALEKYFIIGNTVKTNSDHLDKVIKFNWNNGDWFVIVQAVKKDGTIDSRWPSLRIHATLPNTLTY